MPHTSYIIWLSNLLLTICKHISLPSKINPNISYLLPLTIFPHFPSALFFLSTYGTGSNAQKNLMYARQVFYQNHILGSFLLCFFRQGLAMQTQLICGFTVYSRLDVNSKQSFCLSLSSVGTTGQAAMAALVFDFLSSTPKR